MPVEFLDDKPEEEEKEATIFTPQNPVATGLAESFIDNILGLPNSLARMDNQSRNFVNKKLAGVLGQGVADFMLEPVPEEQGIVPLPSGRQVMSGADAGMRLLTGDFDVLQSYQEGMDARTTLQEQNPGMFNLGNLLGDASTIMMGRAPMVRGTQKAFPNAQKVGDIVAPRIQKVLDKYIKIPSLTQKLSRGLGRPAEAGVEGAVLALMDEDDVDPVEVAVQKTVRHRRAVAYISKNRFEAFFQSFCAHNGIPVGLSV